MAINYHSKNIRTLLIKGFSEEELRIFCFDHPVFKPVYDQLAQVTGKTQIVQNLIEYAEQKNLYDILLDWAKEENPAKYEEHQPYHLIRSPTTSSGDQEEAPKAPVPTLTPSPPHPPLSESPVSNRSGSISEQDLFQLKDVLARRTLALFVGADLPREVTGLPSRVDLARDLAHHYGLDTSLSLAEVAQRLNQAGNRWEFTDFLRHKLDTIGKSPQPFHRQIATLVKKNQISTIITTAYDNLLELAFQQSEVRLDRVVRSSDVNFVGPDQPTLIRLYGDVLQPDTLVVTDKDHTDLLRNRDKEVLIDEVKRAFRRNSILFLGYNLADPDFRFLFDQIAESRFARTAYAIWPNLPEPDVVMWRNRGIVILEADPLAALSGSV
jgi:hypothetical protein